MAHFHHDAPMDEATKIKMNADNVQGARDSSGRSLGQVEGDGIGNLEDTKSAPIFG
jgi:hypothetical protein